MVLVGQCLTICPALRVIGLLVTIMLRRRAAILANGEVTVYSTNRKC
jgi:hypothetical protein